MAPHTQLAHSWSYCVDRVVNYLLLGRLMKSYVFFSLAAAHLTLPSHLPPIPPSVSSVFCVSPSSWNSSTRLARKIGHPLVLLSPLQHSKKIILWGVLCHFVMSKPQSPEYSQNTQKTHMHTYQLKEGGKIKKKSNWGNLEIISLLVRKAFPVEIILGGWLGIEGVEPRVRNLITHTNDMPFLCWEPKPWAWTSLCQPPLATVFIKANNVITIHRYCVGLITVWLLGWYLLE